MTEIIMSAQINPTYLGAMMSGEKIKTHMTPAERLKFYTGEDRLFVSNEQLVRLYDLQKMNDELQREIHQNESSLKHTKDPMVALTQIESAKKLLARNLGEVLMILEHSEIKMRRIAELETINRALAQENHEQQSLWSTISDLQERACVSAKVLLNNELIAENMAEIATLRNGTVA